MQSWISLVICPLIECGMIFGYLILPSVSGSVSAGSECFPSHWQVFLQFWGLVRDPKKKLTDKRVILWHYC